MDERHINFLGDNSPRILEDESVSRVSFYNRDTIKKRIPRHYFPQEEAEIQDS